MEDDDIILPDIDVDSIIAEIFRSRTRLYHNSEEIYESKIDESSPIVVDAKFQAPTFERMLECNGITQYNDSCYPVIHKLIVDKIYEIIHHALIIRDDKNSKIITHEDILTIIRIFGKRITKN
jgi:histone H3/H4